MRGHQTCPPKRLDGNGFEQRTTGKEKARQRETLTGHSLTRTSHQVSPKKTKISLAVDCDNAPPGGHAFSANAIRGGGHDDPPRSNVANRAQH